MTEVHLPGPPARGPGQSVASFLEGFAAWLTDDVRPAIASQARSLATVPDPDGADELALVVRHLETLVVELDELAGALAAPVGAAGTGALEPLLSAAADRCGATRELLARAQVLLDERARRTSAEGCGARPD